MSTTNPHILSRFNEAFGTLRADLLRMGEIAVANLEHAMAGLLERDDDRCNRAIAEDEDVDQLEVRVDRECLDLIARYGPVAGDLRLVISTMKTSNNLERIADQASNIAKRARRLNRLPALEDTQRVAPVHAIAKAMLDDAIAAFRDADLKTALDLGVRDDALDRAHKKLIKHLTGSAEADPARAEDYIDLIFIVRFLERIGDHSVNIGEDCVYAQSAYDIRHGGERPGIS